MLLVLELVWESSSSKSNAVIYLWILRFQKCIDHQANSKKMVQKKKEEFLTKKKTKKWDW